MARRTKWEDDFPQRVGEYARQGMLEKDMAVLLGVTSVTFEDYKNKRPEFLKALKDGKKVVDHEVEMTLLKAALGYEYTETKRITEADGSVRIEESTKYSQPSTTAQIFWLKNRQPNEWRDVSKVEFISVRKALEEAQGKALQEAKERESHILEAEYSEIEPLISDIEAEIDEG